MLGIYIKPTMIKDKYINIPKAGAQIKYQNNKFIIPNNPIIVFIEGDGIGSDITPVMQKVVDSAVKIAYANTRKIHWLEIYAGEKAYANYNEWLPDITLKALKKFHIAIKGPLTTPIGSGIRSLNVTMRQHLDLFICQRPVRYFMGTPSPLKHPEKMDMVIFRENSEDIYAGIEYAAFSDKAKALIKFLQEEIGTDKIRFPESSGIGIKAISKEGTQRLVRSAIEYAITYQRKSVTLVHKGNIMKFTEGAFRNWGYEIARSEFGAKPLDGSGDWHYFYHPKTKAEIVIKDVIADTFFQQVLLRPEDYDVIATMNLNGDYISDALAAQVGGIGMVPGANLSKEVALFEATHGSAPKHARKNKANPSSLILSAQMMLQHMGWQAAADLITIALSHAILNKIITYDLARLIDNAHLVSTSAFGEHLVNVMKNTKKIGSNIKD